MDIKKTTLTLTVMLLLMSQVIIATVPIKGVSRPKKDIPEDWRGFIEPDDGKEFSVETPYDLEVKVEDYSDEDVNTKYSFLLDGEGVGSTSDPNYTYQDLDYGDYTLTSKLWQQHPDGTWIEIASDTINVKINPQDGSIFSVNIKNPSEQAELVEDKEVAVEYKVENIDSESDTQDIRFLVDGEKKEEVTVTLGENDKYESQFSWVPTEPYGDRELTVRSLARKDQVGVKVLQKSNFKINSVDDNGPIVEGEKIDINVEVTNTGDVSNKQYIELYDFSGNRKDVLETELNGGETKDIELTWDTAVGDAGTGHVKVECEEDEDYTDEQIWIKEKADFVVEIVDNNGPIVEGEELTATTKVANTGEEIDEQRVALYNFSGAEVSSKTVELGASEPGEENSTKIELTWQTDTGDAKTDSIEVKTEDGNSDTEDVWVKEKAEFDVKIVDNNGPIVEGEELTVTANVTNTGEETGDQKVGLYDFSGAEVDSKTVELDGGNTKEIELRWPTKVGDAGNGQIKVKTQDGDSDTEEVWVKEEAEFVVEIVETNSPIIEGEKLNITAEVTNTGEEIEEEEVALYNFSDAEVDSETVEFGASEPGKENSTEVELTWQTETGDAKEDSIEVKTEDGNSDSEDVWVKEEADFDVEIVDNNGPIVEGEELTVTADVTNTGEETGDQKVRLYDFSGAEVNSKTVRLEGGTTKEVKLTWPTKVGDAGAGQIKVKTQDGDSDTEDVWVKEKAEFVVEIVETNSPIVEGEKLNITAEVTNTGEEIEEEEVALYNFSDAEVDSETVEFGASEPGKENSTEVELTWKTETGDAKEDSIEVKTEDGNSDSKDVWVKEEGNFEVEILSPGDDTEFVEGEEVHVDFIVNNTGDVDDTQDIEFSVLKDGEEAVYQDIKENMTVSSDEGNKETFTWPTEKGETGEYDLKVKSEDDSTDSEIIMLEDACFEIKKVDHDEEIKEGEVFNINYSLFNNGEVNETQLIRFKVHDEDGKTIHRNNRSLKLTPEEEWREGEFTWKTEAGVWGNYILNLTTEDDYHEAELYISPLKPHSLVIEAAPNDITAGSSFEIEIKGYTEDQYPTPRKELSNLFVKAETGRVLFNSSSVELDENGNYTVNINPDQLVTAGNRTIKVDAREVQNDSYEINVIPAEVEDVMIEPKGEKEISAGEKLNFTAEAYDRHDNLIVKHPSEFDWSGANASGVFEKDAAGIYEVQAEYMGEKSSIKNVTVRPEGTLETVDITQTKNVTLELNATNGVTHVFIGQEENLSDAEKLEFSEKIEYELNDQHGLQDLFVQFSVEDEVRSEIYRAEIYYDVKEADLKYRGLNTIVFEENLEYELEWINEGNKNISHYDLRSGPSINETVQLVSDLESTNYTYEMGKNETVYFELVGYDEDLGEEHVLKFNVTTDLIDIESKKIDVSGEENKQLQVDINENRKENISVNWSVGDELKGEGLTYEPDLEPGEHVVVAEVKDESEGIKTEIVHLVNIEEKDPGTKDNLITADYLFRLDGVYRYMLIGIPIVAVILIAGVLILKSGKSSRKMNDDKKPFEQKTQSSPPPSSEVNSNRRINETPTQYREEHLVNTFKELGQATKATAYNHLTKKKGITTIEYHEFEDDVQELVKEERLKEKPRKGSNDLYIWNE